jgi:hypothetical protein
LLLAVRLLADTFTRSISESLLSGEPVDVPWMKTKVWPMPPIVALKATELPVVPISWAWRYCTAAATSDRDCRFTAAA